MLKNESGQNIKMFQCSSTQTCQNTRCFWKQRDCMGRSPWAMAYQDPSYVEKMKLLEEPYFPKWNVTVGTNCLCAICEDFICGNDGN